MGTTFQDLTVGTELETAGRTITEADVVNFAGVSGDFNGLHLDAERMADTEYGERIAQGALVFSVVTGLIWQAREASEDVVAFYGVDDLRFTAPVFIDDTISATLTVAGKEPRDHPEANGVIRYDLEVTKEDGTVVLVAELLSLVR
ncbi:MAG: MaoC/PaaZ C-terminal domain-containing protein [Halodesulfurarchaeum sp.]